jgi:hypothetical protein
MGRKKQRWQDTEYMLSCFGKKYQIKRPPEVTGRSQGFILLLGCKGVRYDLHGIGKLFRKEPARNRICRKSGRKTRIDINCLIELFTYL